MYNTYGKENNYEDVKGTYIWLSCTLAGVTSAVRGTMIPFPTAVVDDVAVDDIRCTLYPKIHSFLVWL